MSMQNRRRLVGVVVSDKMQKTIVVEVERSIRHPVYQKVLHRSKKYKAHDETGVARQGDTVQIVEWRPLSATKRWKLDQVLRKAGA